MIRMNYLFLDIDGVLNTGRYSNYLVEDHGVGSTSMLQTK